MKLLGAFLLVFVAISCSFESSREDKNPTSDEKFEVKTPWQVEIFAERFKWTIRYSGEDNVLGESDYKLFSETNPLGIMTEHSIQTRLAEIDTQLNEMDSMSLHMEITDKFITRQNKLLKNQKLLRQLREKHDSSLDLIAQNDFIVNDTLVLCVDKEYEFNFRSKDVVHSAYFPHFRAQINLVPGIVTKFKMILDETTEERKNKEKNDSFEFMLVCNKICGAGHKNMKMVVRVVEDDEYQKWIKSNETNAFQN